MTQPLIKPSRKLAEQFEILKVRILSTVNGKARGPFVLAFTSCRNREGVSSVAANFATTLSEDTSRRVLLMDGDLRHPSLHRMFPKDYLKKVASEVRTDEDEPRFDNELVISKGYGVPAVLGDKDLTQPAWKLVKTNSNLDVLLARRRIADPGELFQMREFGEFLNYAKQRYDVIILDCPPVYGGSGSTILSSKADGVVMVVEAGRVRRQAVSRAIELLEETGAQMLGVVLNKRRFPIPNVIYRML